MASNIIYGKFSGTATTNVRPAIEWSSSPNTPGNYSDVTATLVFYRYNTSWQSWNAGGHSVSLSIDGNTASASRTFDIRGVSRAVVWTRTRRVYHNSNGAKSITIAASSSNTGTSLGSYSFSGTAVMDTIPRASSFTSFSNFTVMNGTTNSFNIGLSREATTFTHDATLRVNGTVIQSWTAFGVPTSLTLTSSASNAILNIMSNKTSMTAELRIQTKSGQTNVGSVMTRTATVSVHSSIVPSITSLSVTEYVSSIATGLGEYVQGKSRLSISFGTVPGYGAKDETIKTTLDGKTYTGKSFTSDTLNTTGSRAVKVTFTNTRGQTVSQTVNRTVVAYSSPAIWGINAIRANDSGLPDEQGERAIIQYRAIIAPINNKNTKIFRLMYRPAGTSTWNSTTLPDDGYSVNDAMAFISPHVFDPDLQYDIRMEAQDFFGTHGTNTILSSTFTLINFHQSGEGIAFGAAMQAERGFHVNLPAQFLDDIYFRSYPTTTVVDNDDLNTYIQPGMYYCSTNARAQTMANMPKPMAFSLLVEKHAGAKQTWTSYSATNPETYIRNLYSGAWGAWRQIQFV